MSGEPDDWLTAGEAWSLRIIPNREDSVKRLAQSGYMKSLVLHDLQQIHDSSRLKVIDPDNPALPKFLPRALISDNRVSTYKYSKCADIGLKGDSRSRLERELIPETPMAASS